MNSAEHRVGEVKDKPIENIQTNPEQGKGKMVRKRWKMVKMLKDKRQENGTQTIQKDKTKFTKSHQNLMS